MIYLSSLNHTLTLGNRIKDPAHMGQMSSPAVIPGSLHTLATETGPEQAKFKWSGQSMCTMRAKCASARGVWGHAPPGDFWNFRCSEIDSGAFCDSCLSWQCTCYKLTIVYTCEKDCKYSTIMNSDRHIIEICSCKSLRYTCCACVQNHALVSTSYPHRSQAKQGISLPPGMVVDICG